MRQRRRREGLSAMATMSPTREDITRPRDARSLTKEFVRRARKLGFPALRFHDLRGTHENTLLLDAGVLVHVVAARCGHDPAICSALKPGGPRGQIRAPPRLSGQCQRGR